MSKNKYLLPCFGIWYVEYGGNTKETSHSWNISSQRYAYDLEIRKDNLPYHGDYHKIENYYSYLQDVLCPCDGFVIDVEDSYENTKIYNERPVCCDIEDSRGNYITIKHRGGEYSTVCHLEKNSALVKVGQLVTAGEKIGKVGNSGNTQGPHIHFQVQKGANFYHDEGVPITFKKTYCNGKKCRRIEQGMSVYKKEG